MKKKSFVLLLCLVATTLFAQKVIENPAYEVKRSSIYDVVKIELTTNETRLHVKGTIHPGWHMRFRKNDFLKDCKSGKEYPIIRIEDHKFNEKILIPDSGTRTVVLVFPPLDKGVKKIDFKHAIYGISLNKQQSNKPIEVPKYVNKWIEKELNKVKEEPIKDFNSAQFFNPKKAKLIGYIKEYDRQLKYNTGIVYQGNNITREDYPIVVQVYEDGRFEAEIPLIHPETNFMSINEALITYYLEPGQTLALILDAEDFKQFFISRMTRSNNRYKFKNTIFKGPLAKVNKHLLNFNYEYFDYRNFREKAKTLTPEEFKAEQDSIHNKNKDLFKEYANSNKIDTKTREVLKNTLITDYATFLFDYIDARAYEAKQNELFANLQKPITNEFYSFLKDIDFNNKGLLVPRGFSTFVNRFEFSEPLKIYPKHKYKKLEPKITFKQYIERNKIIITENDKKLIEESKGKGFSSYEEYQNFLKKYSKPYREALNKYNLDYIQPLVDKRNADITEKTMEKWRLRDSVIQNVYHLDKNIVNEITKIRALKFDIDRTDSKNARKYWSALKQTISDPFLIQQGERIVDKRFPEIQKINQKDSEKLNTSNVTLAAKTTKLPKGKPTDIFNNIIKSHKNKILFVDFWATSCAPCVGSIKRMKEVRAKYKDNPDIDFVFITEQKQSPERRYNSFVKDQELVNTYRIPVDDFNYLRQLFKFNGIPKYIVISKNGEVIDDDYQMYQFNRTVDNIIKNYK